MQCYFDCHVGNVTVLYPFHWPLWHVHCRLVFRNDSTIVPTFWPFHISFARLYQCPFRPYGTNAFLVPWPSSVSVIHPLECRPDKISDPHSCGHWTDHRDRATTPSWFRRSGYRSDSNHWPVVLFWDRMLSHHSLHCTTTN